jgi:hypothetical protein
MLHIDVPSRTKCNFVNIDDCGKTVMNPAIPLANDMGRSVSPPCGVPNPVGMWSVTVTVLPLAILLAREPNVVGQAVAHRPSRHDGSGGNRYGFNRIARATVTANADDCVVHQTMIKV